MPDVSSSTNAQPLLADPPKQTELRWWHWVVLSSVSVLSAAIQAFAFASHSSGLEVGRDHAPDMHGHGAFGLVLRRAEALPVPLRAMDFDVG